MESYILVLASLILLIPIIMYLPLGITSKGKVIIILGAILVATIGVYVNMNFPLWQTAGMLVLIIIAMTFFMGEKFEGLIFDQEGNDLTAYKSDEPEGEIEEKDDLIHLIGNQKQAKGLRNQELQQEQPKDTKAEIGNGAGKEDENLTESPETISLEKNQMIEPEHERSSVTEVPLTQGTINWDEEMELLQNESPLISKNELEVKDDGNIEQQVPNPAPAQMIEDEGDELLFISNKEEPYGSLTNDEVAFLLNRDELISPEESSVHYMEDIEIILEDEDEDLIEAKDLIVEEPSIDPIINVFAEEDFPPIIDELEEENPFNKNITEDLSDEHVQSDLVDLEKEHSINTEESKPEPIIEPAEGPVSGQQAVNHFSDITEETQVNELEEVNSSTKTVTEGLLDEHLQSELVDLEKEHSINTEEPKPEPIVEPAKQPISDQQATNHLSDSTEEIPTNEWPEDVLLDEEKMNLNNEPVQQEAQKPSKPSPEHSVLQAQLFDTFFYQIKLAKMTCSEDEYELLIKGYLTAELPDQTYYRFSSLLLDHFIEKKKWEELKQILLELQIRFEQYPILTKQLEYLYQTYCV